MWSVTVVPWCLWTMLIVLILKVRGMRCVGTGHDPACTTWRKTDAPRPAPIASCGWHTACWLAPGLILSTEANLPIVQHQYLCLAILT